MLRVLSAAAVMCVLSLASVAPSYAGEPTHVSLNRQSTGTYYVAGEIRGHGALALLVDTGSSYLVINEEILADLKAAGGATYSRDLQGTLANGTETIVPLYRIDSVRLGESCWVHDIEAAVFPQATRTILGMNVLQRLAPITFSVEPPALSLHQCAGQALSESEPAGATTARAAVQPAASVPRGPTSLP